MSFTPKNLYPPFSSSSQNIADWAATTETYLGQTCYRRKDAWSGLCNIFFLEQGTYTYSLYIRTSVARPAYIYSFSNNGYPHYSESGTADPKQLNLNTLPGDNAWHRYSYTFDVTQAGYFAIRVEATSTINAQMYIAAPQLEVGSTATDFEPYNCTWYIGLDGELYNTNFIDLPSAAMATPYPHALWRIESGYNEGRPFNMLLPDISNIVPWVQPSEPVIHVYSSQDNEFTTNGYAILEPISCEVHHEENGVYEATLETYCDEYNKFTYVKKQAQIRIPLKYHGETNHQIFRIRECTRRMDEQGNYRIVATAQHKFYDLTRYMIEDCRPTSLDGDAALTWLFTHGWYGNETDDEFTYSSDITNSRTAYYQNMNVVNALLGADQCFVNRWGGKLFRDNTYFSLNNTMENARDAGVICYGYNMTEIELVENDSDLITVLIAEDNYGNKYTLTNESVPTEAIPHHIYGYARFTYDAEDVDAFHADAQAYFDEHKQSSLNLTVRFANLSDIDLYKDFLALDDYEVGDHITVYHKDLDIFYANLEIISKTFDVVSQKTSEIQIGSLRSAITSRPFMSQTVSSGNSVEDKQYISLDDQLDEVAFFAVVQYPISTEDDELLVTSDGKYLQYQP